MIEGFTGERCPRCGTEAEVYIRSGWTGKWLECPKRTCQAYKLPNGKWTPGYGGEKGQEK